MQLPGKLLQSLEGMDGFDKEAFEKVHSSGQQVTSVRINPGKKFEFRPEASGLKFGFSTIPWTQYGFYLAERPSFTFDPLFHAGCYYVQEASSMFLEQALKQTIDLSRPIRVLDVSAAPGGKSTHMQSLISPESLLVSNDVIRSRANILKDNLIKWGCENVVVTNNDPRDFGKLENYFDVVVVDAPCSGSGLFRRDPEAIGQWSENNVALCSQRRQRILADVVPALKKDGVLIYSTCSYSKEEDEDIIDWIGSGLKIKNVELKIENSWHITEIQTHTGAIAYRFWPHKVKGEGFFIACFKKTDREESSFNLRNKAEAIAGKEMEVIGKWVETKEHHFIKNENTIWAWPKNLVADMNTILSKLRVIYSGIRVGELIRDKLIPDHALAMSNHTHDSITRIELNEELAIQYLQRKEIKINGIGKGWQLVNYKGHALGWVNVLPGRINNYYPKELRILKDVKSPPR